MLLEVSLNLLEMLKFCSFLLTVLYSISLQSQDINPKIYFAYPEIMLYSYSDTNNTISNITPTVTMDRLNFYPIKSTSQFDPVPIGSRYSPTVKINGNSNNWIVYKGLIISVDLLDEHLSSLPDVFARFRVTPLSNLFDDLTTSEYHRIFNGSNNLSNKPLESIRRYNRGVYNIKYLSRINYDFIVYNNDLLFLLLVDDGPLELWRCQDEVNWRDDANRNGAFAHMAKWELIDTLKFEPGELGFIAANYEDSLILIDSLNNMYVLDVDKSSISMSGDIVLLRKYSRDVNYWIFDFDNKLIGGIGIDKNKFDADTDFVPELFNRAKTFLNE